MDEKAAMRKSGKSKFTRTKEAAAKKAALNKRLKSAAKGGSAKKKVLTPAQKRIQERLDPKKRIAARAKIS